MRQILAVVALLGLLAAVPGCPQNRPGMQTPKAAGTPVKMSRNFAGYEENFRQEKLHWLRSQAELNATNSTLLRDMRINWEKQSVLVAALGAKPTGGYGVRINSVLLDKKNLHVLARTVEPPPGAAVTQGTTYPIAIAVIEYNAPDAVAYLHTEAAAMSAGSQ